MKLKLSPHVAMVMAVFARTSRAAQSCVEDCSKSVVSQCTGVSNHDCLCNVKGSEFYSCLEGTCNYDDVVARTLFTWYCGEDNDSTIDQGAATSLLSVSVGPFAGNGIDFQITNSPTSSVTDSPSTDTYDTTGPFAGNSIDFQVTNGLTSSVTDSPSTDTSIVDSFSTASSAVDNLVTIIAANDTATSVTEIPDPQIASSSTLNSSLYFITDTADHDMPLPVINSSYMVTAIYNYGNTTVYSGRIIVDSSAIAAASVSETGPTVSSRSASALSALIETTPTKSSGFGQNDPLATSQSISTDSSQDPKTSGATRGTAVDNMDQSNAASSGFAKHVISPAAGLLVTLTVMLITS